MSDLVSEYTDGDDEQYWECAECKMQSYDAPDDVQHLPGCPGRR